MLRIKDTLSEYRRLNAVVALNAPLVTLILLRNTWSLHFDLMSWVYFLSVSLGYYVLAIFILASVSYFVLCPVRKLALGISGLLITAVVYYLLIDSYTLGIISMHIDLFWLEWVINDFNALGLSSETLLSALLALLALFAIEAAIFAVSKRARARRYLVGCSWMLLLLLFVVSQVTHAVGYERNDVRVTGMTPRLPFYMPVTSHRNAVRYGDMLPIGEDKFLPEAADLNGTLQYPLRKIECGKVPDSSLPNIVVLFLEGWRYDMLNDSVTPHINTLAQKSTVGLNHFCSGNSTVAGVFGFFYGLHPTYWSAVKANNAVIHNPVLMDVLAENDYTFGIYAKSNFERHKVKDAVFRDIDIHEDFAGRTPVEQDADMTGQLISFLHDQKQTGKHFMAYAFYKANHAPYWYPPTDTVFRPAGDKNLMASDDHADPTRYLNDYRNATRYVDRLVGNVLDELDTLGLMKNTIVIVTTDHGEEFNDDKTGCWGHGSNYTQYQIRVPLIFYAPNRAPSHIEQVTCHVDVVPTLLEEYFGCLNPAGDYSNGRNLYRDGGEKRPLVIGSYVNHAFVIEDNIHEISPLYVREYKLSSVKAKASPPSVPMIKQIAAEIGRFLDWGEDGFYAEP
jgi:membrane-anchored protein YejM (alkaline phosphatase superfamily)